VIFLGSWWSLKNHEADRSDGQQVPDRLKRRQRSFPLLPESNCCKGLVGFFVGGGFTLPTIPPRSAMPMPANADFLRCSEHSSEWLQVAMVITEKSGEIHRRITSMLHRL
jgi:hypothetical protein